MPNKTDIDWEGLKMTVHDFDEGRVSQRILEQEFDNFLDEVCGPIKIAGYEYATSLALERVDPIAYNQEFLSWLDSQCGDGYLEERNGEYYRKDPNDEE